MKLNAQNHRITTIREKLAGYITGCVARNEVRWYELERYASAVLQDKEEAEVLHQSLQPFYLEYLTGQNYELYQKPGIYSLLYGCIRGYRGLGEWFAHEVGIMDVLDGLAVNHAPYTALFSRMSLLLGAGYRPFVKEWDRERIEDEIARQQVQKELQRGEYLCILHAYMMIEGSDRADEEKDRLEVLFRQHWDFLRNVYSIMVGSVIGTKQKTFTQVCNNVKLMVEEHPYLHLFVSAIEAREEIVIPNEKERKKMDKHFMYLQDVINQTPQEDTLDEVCKILFGEDFEKALVKKRYTSYRELERLVGYWQQMATGMGEQLKEIEPLKQMCQSMKEALEKSIPVEEICNVILGFDDPKVSESVFNKLDWDLEENAAWASKRKEMKKLIKAKLLGPEKYREEMRRIAEGGWETQRMAVEALKEVADKPTTQNIVYPQANSTTNVGCDQKDSEFRSYLPLPGGAAVAMEQKEEQKKIGGLRA